MNLQQLLVQAIKDKDTVKINTLRLLISQVELTTKSGLEVNLNKIISKQIAQRKETLSYCEKLDRLEEALILNEEIDYLTSLLPKQITEQELNVVIQKIIAENGFAGIKSMSNLVKLVTAEVDGKIDSKLIGKNCKQALL